MTFRVFKKEVKEHASYNNKKLLCCSYCELQTLLRFRSIYGHTERPEGWGADVYDLDKIVLTTGYDPFGKLIPHIICKKYEEKARKLYNTKKMHRHEYYVNKLDKIITEFENEAINLTGLKTY